jgi:hypothetical protein
MSLDFPKRSARKIFRANYPATFKWQGRSSHGSISASLYPHPLRFGDNSTYASIVAWLDLSECHYFPLVYHYFIVYEFG